MADEAADLSPTSATDATVRHWLDVIGRYDREFADWTQRVDKIWKVYTEERRKSTTSAKRRLALYWASVSVMRPAIYARLPRPQVSRRFKDADPVARVAGEIIERGLTYTFDTGDAETLVGQVCDDYILGARGTAWARYEAEFEPIPGDELPEPANDDAPDPDAKAPERIAGEKVCLDYVHWRDFGHTPARYWQEVTAVWRKVYLTRTELTKRFGAEIADQVGLDQDRGARGQFLSDGARKATTYEIWDRATRKVYFIAKSCPVPLEVRDPFLNLEGFWPCPRPAYGTLGTESLVPVPDYIYVQDQLDEIDHLTARIAKLLDALKLVGFYAKGDDTSGSLQLERALTPGVENTIIGVPSWAAFSEKGGVNQIQWLPVDQVIKVLQGCFQARKELKEELYEVTGISDIMRGQTEASETLGAQQLKMQSGSIRVRPRQKVLGQFVRELSRIAGEIVADKFQPETLMRMANMTLPSEAELAMAAMAAQLAQAGAGGLSGPMAGPMPPGPAANAPGPAMMPAGGMGPLGAAA